VAGDVGEGLLDDPVGRLADRGRQRPGLAFSLERHPQPARLHAGDQLLDVLYRRRGLARGLTAAEEVERGAQLGEGLLAGFLDGGQGRTGPVGLLVEEMEGDAGLHVDQRYVVGEHVVELLGELETLVGRLALRFLFFDPLALLGAHRLDPGDLRHGHEHPRPADDEEEMQRPVRLHYPRRQAICGDQRHHPRRHPGIGGVPTTSADGGEHRHHDAEEHRPVGVAHRQIQVGRHHRHRHRRHRPSVPPHQRQRTGEQEEDGEGVERVAEGLPVAHRRQPGRPDLEDGDRQAGRPRRDPHRHPCKVYRCLPFGIVPGDESALLRSR